MINLDKTKIENVNDIQNVDGKLIYGNEIKAWIASKFIAYYNISNFGD